MDRDARRARLDDEARLFAVDDEGVGRPPPAGLVGHGPGPALERHGVVHGQDDGHPPCHAGQHGGVEPRDHLGLDVDDVGTRPGHGAQQRPVL